MLSFKEIKKKQKWTNNDVAKIFGLKHGNSFEASPCNIEMKKLIERIYNNSNNFEAFIFFLKKNRILLKAKE